MKKVKATTTPTTITTTENVSLAPVTPSPLDALRQAKQGFSKLKTSGGKGGYAQFLPLILEHSIKEAQIYNEAKAKKEAELGRPLTENDPAPYKMKPLTALEIRDIWEQRGHGRIQGEPRKIFQPLIRKEGKRGEDKIGVAFVEYEGMTFKFTSHPQSMAERGIGYLMSLED